MIKDEILDKICPVPTEEEEVAKIREELEEEGFIISEFKKGSIFYFLIRLFVMLYISLKKVARNLINDLYVNHASEDWLELKAADFGKKRKPAIKARGNITITRRDYSSALLIAKGHIFKTKQDTKGKEKKYYVLENIVIPPNERVWKVLVEAEEVGESYNVTEGEIVKSLIHLEGVESLTNERDWLVREGAEIEDLEAFRTRIRESWSELAELTIEDKLKNVARKVEGVIDAEIDAQHPRGQGTTDIIVTGANGEATRELLQKVEKEIEHLKGNYDDFLCKSVAVTRQNFELNLVVNEEVDKEETKRKAEEIVKNMMQLVYRKEKNSLYLDDVRYALKTEIKGYKRTEFVDPTSDIELAKGNIVILGSLNLTVKNSGE